MQVDTLPSALKPAATSLSTTSPTTNASGSLPTNASFDNSNLFITLLTAQLQAQDPLNPMSAQDMVSQLTQISSLQQLISIKQSLQNIAGGNSPAATSQSGPASKIQ